MKQKKQEYSLTARERKELRRKQSGSAQPVQPEITEQPEGGEAVKNKMDSKTLWISVSAIVLALVLILTAVILLVIVPQNSKYPRVTFDLVDSNNNRIGSITMVVYEDEAPIAATNFLFLAKIGFFNDTIIYDVQSERQFMRFGAYEGYGTNQTKYKNADFIAEIDQKIFNVVNADPDFAHTSAAQSNKFGYRLKKDKNAGTRYGDEAYMVSFRNSEAADFVINTLASNRDFKVNGSDISTYLVPFGKFEDEKSQEIIDSIMQMEKNLHTGLSDVVGTTPQVKISKTTLSNMNKKKWKNFEFITYMSTAYDGSTAISAWYNS